MNDEDREQKPVGGREVKFSADLTRGFLGWLIEMNTTLTVTTYQVGKVFFFGVTPEGALWVFNRNIGRCLGCAGDSEGVWIAADSKLHRFDNITRNDPDALKGADALFAPRVSYVTGDLDIHDVGIDAEGAPVFVNTAFNCLARPSLKASFEPVWRPPFISRLAGEDRCHLNGLAMRKGRPAFVTAIAETDTFDAWRQGRSEGGIVIDVESGEVVCRGLSMPHSPRWHEGRLYLLNSGSGEFGYVDPRTGNFEPVAFCPGYLRGLSFIGGYAVVGLSKPRDNKTFSGLPLDDALCSRKIESKCGIYVIDLKSGDIAHSMVFEGIITELYDVVAIEGIRQPRMLGLNDERLARTISLP